MKMGNFFNLSAAGGGFRLFGAAHLLWLFGALAAIAALSAGYQKVGERTREAMRKTTALAALALELTRAGVIAAQGLYDITRLPLHLCGMAVYLDALHALRPGKLLGQFLYAFCMPGAVAALLFPDWVAFAPLSFMSVCAFTLHILLVGYTAMQVYGGDITPQPRLAPACLAIMLLLAAPVCVFDRLTGTNYMFLNWPSPGSPLEWFAPLGRPGYLLGYIPLLAAAWAPLYLPSLLRGKKAERRQAG